MKKINKRTFCIVLLSLICIVLIVFYCSIIKHHVIKKQFSKSNVELSKNNEEDVFKIEKLIICSSANATDKSEENNLSDLTLYQYTDIAVYINNGEELTDKNTIKELYIDNIELSGNNNIGSKSLTYKKANEFGLKKEIKEPKDNNDIYFNVVHTNEESQNANYDEPTFYTDCSNPITLEYLNYGIKTNYKLNEDSKISFDGNILESAGISPLEIACKVKFKINIINNKNEKYSCPINFDIPLDDIYSGTTMKAKNTKSEKYVFFREY